MTSTLTPVPAPAKVSDPAPLLRDALGQALRDERLARKRTLRDVAKASQVSLAYLSEIERGQKEASSEILAAVCDALGITMLDLVATVARSYAQHEGVGLAVVRTDEHVEPYGASACALAAAA